jgi:hypothetical protein
MGPGLAMGSGVAKVAGTPRKLIKNSSKIPKFIKKLKNRTKTMW